MSTITREWVQQKIADMEATRDDIPFGLCEDGTNTLAAMKLALASLEAEPVGIVRHIELRGPEHPAGIHVSLFSRLDDGIELYTAPPAPVSVPDYPETLPCPVMLEPGLRFGKGVPTKTMLGALQRRSEYYAELEAMTPEQRAEHDAGMKEFAAMLQSAEHVSNRDELPDGWVACSERLPEPEVDVQVYCSDKKEQMVGYLERNEREGCFRFATWRNGDGIYCQPTHWMPLPAAPQQEADNV